MIKITQTSIKTKVAHKKRALNALKKLQKRQDLGFLRLPYNHDLIAQADRRAQEILKNYDKTVVLGIGGSSLGGQVFKDFSLSERVEFFENVDGSYLLKKLEELSLHNTHWIITSKSGSTIETLSQVNFLCSYYDQKRINFFDHCTVITELKGNPLFNWAKKNKILILELPTDVGGRFSVLSPVGLLPAALMGLNLQQICKGASWALDQTDIVADLAAQTIMSWERKEWVTVFWIYSDFLSQLGPWIQQLWSESLAKKTNRKNKKAPRTSTPVPMRGTRDQHSMLQQLMEGYRDKFVWFIQAEPSSSNTIIKKDYFDCGMQNKSLDMLFEIEAVATQKALNANKVKTLVLTIQDVSPQTLGAVFMLMQLVIGVLGELLDINAFDQPGVEIGKRLARQRLIELDK